MKKLMAVLLIIAFMFTISACGSSSYSTDDSYKNKTWDQMNGAEKEKTREDIGKAIEKSKAAGAEW